MSRITKEAATLNLHIMLLVAWLSTVKTKKAPARPSAKRLYRGEERGEPVILVLTGISLACVYKLRMNEAQVLAFIFPDMIRRPEYRIIG